MTARKYEVQYIFDASSTTADDLLAQVQTVLGARARHLDIRLSHMRRPPRLLLTIKGSLKTLNDGDVALGSHFATQGTLQAVRWKDEPGEVIRRRIYPIVAGIEQDFRNFVNKALIEIIGFTWWNDWLPATIQKDIETYSQQNKQYYSTLHPLEVAQFSQLVALVTTSATRWPPNKPLTVQDFNDLLEGCSSVADVHRKLAENTKHLSMWDDVFALYFADASQWRKLESTLRFVITERNKVMHHQPMQFEKIAALAQKQKEIQHTLASAKRKLSPDERTEAAGNLRAISDVYRRTSEALASHMKTLIESMRETSGLGAELTKPSSLATYLMQQARLTADMAKPLDAITAISNTRWLETSLYWEQLAKDTAAQQAQMFTQLPDWIMNTGTSSSWLNQDDDEIPDEEQDPDLPEDTPQDDPEDKPPNKN